MSFEISLSNLDYNINSIQNYIGKDTLCCPMVKANAYGHGDIVISNRLVKNGISSLGVATIQEGIKLRKSFPEIKILVFGSNYDVNGVIDYKLTPVICTIHDLKKFENHNINIHIKFDTGMGRLGFNIEDVAVAKEFLAKSKLKLEGLATHFASGFDINDPKGFSQKQISKFNKIKSHWTDKLQYHYHNSASLLTKDFDDNIGARPGLCMYGVYPPKIDKFNFQVRPVMSITSEVVQIKPMAQNTPVSYSQSHIIDQDSVVAVVDFGYTNGILRSASNKLKILINGKKYPQIGFITMNYMIIKVDDSVKVGDKVTILGKDGDSIITALDIAGFADTIPNEVLTNFGNGKINT